MMKNFRLHLLYGATILVLVCAITVQAATITFTVPDAIVPELVSAMQSEHGRLDGETDANLVRRCTRDFYWRGLVEKYRRRAAEQTAAPVAGSDFGTN